MSNNPIKRSTRKRKDTTPYESHIIRTLKRDGYILKLHATKGWRRERPERS